jgi:hypothetical protein
MKIPEQEPCHPNLTKAEEENYDIDPLKVTAEQEECSPAEKKTKEQIYEGSLI